MPNYDTERREMLSFVPTDARRILDVGCDTGRFGAALREKHPGAEIWGIDLSEHPGAMYDCRIAGIFPDSLPIGESFDCIVFNDVLEHMEDPWSALVATSALLATGGCVVASIPNIRNFRVLGRLVVKGSFEYVDLGILDRTHLRFFTRSSIVSLFTKAGYTISQLEPINMGTTGRAVVVNRLLRSRLDDFVTPQYAVVAKVS